MIGAYYLVRDLLVSTGALAARSSGSLDPGVNFATAAVLGAIGTIYYFFTTRLASGREAVA